jgi:uncharacterized protein YgiB involved in biofilm formation
MNRNISLTLLSAALFLPLVLSGCESEPETVAIPKDTNFGYKSVKECVDGKIFTEQYCQGAYKKALEDFKITAPKYKSVEDCEKENGKGNCTISEKSSTLPQGNTQPQQSQHSSGGSVWTPLMAGWIMRGAFDDLTRPSYNGSYGFSSRPDGGYQSAKGSFVHPSHFSNTARYSPSSAVRSGGFGGSSGRSFSRATSRGGFGRSSGGFSRGGGFGG